MAAIRVLIIDDSVVVRRFVSDVVAAELGTDLRDVPGAGAAGGLGFGLNAVLGAPLHELVDRVVPIDEIWGRAGRDLLDALAPVEGRSQALVATLEGALLRRLDRARPAADAELVRHATRALATGATAGILALAGRLGVGERTLRQSFREHVGISPKRYARIARIRRIVNRAGNATWADLALEHGLYDQAHLNAEFRALLGVAPRDFLAGRLPFGEPRTAVTTRGGNRR